MNAWTETWFSPKFADWNLNEDLPKVHCPVLIIHGENDEYGSRRHPEHIGARTAGSAKIEILPECGHVPYREKEGDLIAMIGTFLGQNGSSCTDAFSGFRPPTVLVERRLR